MWTVTGLVTGFSVILLALLMGMWIDAEMVRFIWEAATRKGEKQWSIDQIRFDHYAWEPMVDLIGYNLGLFLFMFAVMALGMLAVYVIGLRREVQRLTPVAKEVKQQTPHEKVELKPPIPSGR